MAVHTHTHTVYSYQREELEEVAKVCLPYSKITYNAYGLASNFLCNFICDFAYTFTCEIVNKAVNKNKNTYYEYKKIGVV